MKAMILAAGRGRRLAHLTNKIPKPMVSVAGKPVIDHTMDRLTDMGIDQIVINVHHLGEKLQSHLGNGQRWNASIHWSQENILLETGGGVCNALPLLGDEPFVVINGDILWDFALEPLIQSFDPARMDALLALVDNPVDVKGDFVVDEHGRLQRGQGLDSFTYTGVQIINPKALREFAIEPFSLNRLYDVAMKSRRLFGKPISGHWFDMGTPERLARAESIWNRLCCNSKGDQV
ncbi:MAG: nucleotidyltransferase family protein [Magnetococcales bacterium]|nr:nucleotidyltransferase family protein [Magnetococcales bacterium]